MTEPARNPGPGAEWQRAASRRLFQGDLAGAIEAMGQAVLLEPDSFHHWMWLRKLYQQAGDEANTIRCAREGLRCLDDAPDPTISPEERTRLIVRASLSAGMPDRARSALSALQVLRRTALEACLNAPTFGDWYVADQLTAPMFETILELWQVIGDSEALLSVRQKYRDVLRHGLELAIRDDADEAEIANLRMRCGQQRDTSEAG